MKKLIPIALLFSLSLSSPLLGQSDDAVDAKIPESAAPIPNITVDQPEYIIPPTHPDQKYGTHPRQIFDIWLAPSEHPSPVFLSIHGGGFRGGKRSVKSKILTQCLENGISVAALTYRFSSDAIQPSSFVDVARAVQTIRSRATEWNLDKTRFASSGGSAGAGLSLWLAFHDDMAKPNSPDLIAQQSTRLLGAYVSNGQYTYDPRTVRKMFPGKDTWRHSALALMFGIDMDELDHLPQEKYDLMESIAAINHLTADDPPVILTYSRAFDIEVTSQSIGIHHPDFGIMLKKAMDKLNIDCFVYANKEPLNGQPWITQIEFLKTQFGLE